VLPEHDQPVPPQSAAVQQPVPAPLPLVSMQLLPEQQCSYPVLHAHALPPPHVVQPDWQEQVKLDVQSAWVPPGHWLSVQQVRQSCGVPQQDPAPPEHSSSPSSVVPLSQSLSMSSQISGAPGLTLAVPSLQSPLRDAV
jgi:hypothetical protein